MRTTMRTTNVPRSLLPETTCPLVIDPVSYFSPSLARSPPLPHSSHISVSPTNMPELESVSLLTPEPTPGAFTPTPGQSFAVPQAPSLEGRISGRAHAALLRVVSERDVVYACTPKWSTLVVSTSCWLLGTLGFVFVVIFLITMIAIRQGDYDLKVLAALLCYSAAYILWSAYILRRLFLHGSSYMALTLDDVIFSDVRPTNPTTNPIPLAVAWPRSLDRVSHRDASSTRALTPTPHASDTHTSPRSLAPAPTSLCALPTARRT